MSVKSLAHYVQPRRRYARSINLERDGGNPETLTGYVLTERATTTLEKILHSFGHKRRHRAWTITGVYGTGKSAFAHFLSSLFRPHDTAIHQEAMQIARSHFAPDSEPIRILEKLPQQGCVIAIATGQQEPISLSILRALISGVESFFEDYREHELHRDLVDLRYEFKYGKGEVKQNKILRSIQTLLEEAQSNVFIIIDELGKNLEYVSQHQGIADLYLLQQIAELKTEGKHQVYSLVLLHQSFGGYSDRLSAQDQNEWIKVQGRFEDIVFRDVPSQMTRLIAQVLDGGQDEKIQIAVNAWAQDWDEQLCEPLASIDLTRQTISQCYPLHPLTALVLPILCLRYAQNDRSLFTFLTSDEPFGLMQFLTDEMVEDDHLPTLKLDQLYDYFVESVTGLTSRFNLQRWVEIRSLIEDACNQPPETVKILKTIGILNLITTTGPLRATPELVTLALCDQGHRDREPWQTAVTTIQKRGLVTHRRQLNELRLWEGSDFNVDQAVDEQRDQVRSPLADLLAHVHPLKPYVAQRHYTQTGTLRYFEQRYGDGRLDLAALTCGQASDDGLILYWLDPTVPRSKPQQTQDGKPLVFVQVGELDRVRSHAQELLALQRIQRTATELQRDGVARREIAYRIRTAAGLLAAAIAQSLSWQTGVAQCWSGGKRVKVVRSRQFQTLISNLCDATYPQGLRLDNELINRRELTTQGSKARRVLMAAMLTQGEMPRLGFEGYGPEVAVYGSVLAQTGIHRAGAAGWEFGAPQAGSGVEPVWAFIEEFCQGAQTAQRNLGELYEGLARPPYGVKAGVIPVLIAAVLLAHQDDVGVYMEGTFIPVLGVEHFELLVKDPARFAVKFFEIVGVRSRIFQELESMLRSAKAQAATTRNPTLISVVAPLYQFVQKLPRYTRHTGQLSPAARGVLRALAQTVEPDTLLFEALPMACGLEPIRPTAVDDPMVAVRFRESLTLVLRELNMAYDLLLAQCQERLCTAFGVQRGQDLRGVLRSRGVHLVGHCSDRLLNAVVRAMVDDVLDDRPWLESVMMTLVDKPAAAWTDGTVNEFERMVADVARRFRNLEALQGSMGEMSDNRDRMARLLTVTQPNGEEVHRLVWAAPEEREQVAGLIAQVLASQILRDNPQLRQVLAAQLTEHVLAETAPF
ncbi:hypothetical protein PN441_00470 [Spirulina major CS-329]|uniref:hypothetical protein n=1 Tax=Spirulina TaxID=1154 RepID=UPI00232B490B|nr:MULTISPECIES: hypothetical protein [Spirulina]MDB9493876.1 hypothetical protein [Spirulina subsalsa CS-330]MDB9501527.1 hypothetical protein [Spirulina major CS-329]